MAERESRRLRGLDRGERCALLISECQTAIIDPAIALFKGLAEAATARRLPERIATLARQCRAAGIPVVHCIVRLPPDERRVSANSPLHAMMRRNPFLRRDHPSSAIHPGIPVEAEDMVSDRPHGITAFHDAGLETALRAFGTQTVILTGVSTNIALVGTGIEAVNRGFAVVIPEDCTAGATAETHRHSIETVLPVLGTVTDSAALAPYLAARAG